LGQRILAVAFKAVLSDHRELRFEDVDGLTLLGIVGIIDPPRDEAIEAVRQCQMAGIRVKMITGDHAATARAIATQVGLGGGSVLTGEALDHLGDEELRERSDTVDVFARTSPEHKLRLVRALQARGHVVAMTGDGVNDAPALKRADVGVAMGLKGTEAAKEAAEMVLTDDNFASIAHAVQEGRTVYDNLKKAILFLLPLNGGESFTLITAMLLGYELPITPVQILWINMLSSVTLAITLAFEPPEPDVMKRAPRPVNEPLLSGLLAWRIGFVTVLFVLGVFGMFAWARARGVEIAEARTLAVNTLVMLEVFYLFNVRYLKAPSLTPWGILGTRAVLAGLALVAGLQLMFTYAPFMERFFDTRALNIMQCALIFAVGVASFTAIEIEKMIHRRIGFSDLRRSAAPSGMAP
jgi:magnesium-transporting ATPase (P-type)